MAWVFFVIPPAGSMRSVLPSARKISSAGPGDAPPLLRAVSVDVPEAGPVGGADLLVDVLYVLFDGSPSLIYSSAAISLLDMSRSSFCATWHSRFVMAYDRNTCSAVSVTNRSRISGLSFARHPLRGPVSEKTPVSRYRMLPYRSGSSFSISRRLPMSSRRVSADAKNEISVVRKAARTRFHRNAVSTSAFGMRLRYWQGSQQDSTKRHGQKRHRLGAAARPVQTEQKA